MRLAILASHPVQYYGPLYRELAHRLDLKVFFAHRATPAEQARAGFGVDFDWDVDITTGYDHTFLANRSANPGTEQFNGCDTPEIGMELDNGRFDALLVHGWHLKSYVQGVVAAKRCGIPVLVRGDSQLETARSIGKKVLKAALFPPGLRVFDAALYVGQRSRAYYAHYRYPEDRLFFSPHCVDNAWFAARATPEVRKRARADLAISDTVQLLLFAGKLIEWKRPTDLIKAVALCRAREQTAEILVAGDGELRSTLEGLAQQSNVPIHMLGFCNQTEMPEAYAAADCLVLPSSNETWGLVANEALACGRPIIVSDACGCAADLTAGETVGRVFPVGEVPALATAIGSVAQDPPRARAIAEVSSAYSLSAAAEGVLAGLNRVVAKTKR
ncbi:MAG: glycosyltransferase family 4 protein [Pseudomonadota bacterium]